jgi:hypothetical protein
VTTTLCRFATASSCVGRRRPITRAVNAQPLQVADLPTLLSGITKRYDAVRDFSATVKIVPAIGNAEKNNIIEYNHVVDSA